MSESWLPLLPNESAREVAATMAIRGSGILEPADLGATIPAHAPPPASERRTALIKAQYPIVEGYEIIRQLGRGGMGIVYLARDVTLNRLVALKIVVGGAFAGVEAIERFRREAEAVAALHHANIVQVYHVGTSEIGMDGGPACPFIALEYADGGTLAAHTGKPMPPRLAAELIATLADAVQYAHSRGIVHRDLKPGNVLMRVNPQPSNGGEGLLDRLTPKVTDFGLAKRVDGAGEAIPCQAETMAGSMLGTPEYMAPEQAQGQSDIGPAADVYALGAMLFELLAARVPLQGADALDTLVRVRTQEPLAPSRLQPRLPRDLDTICLRCLHKEPERRYASAAELAADLRAWLDGRPIQSRPVGYNERVFKWVRRRPAVASLLAAVLFVGFIGFVGVFSQWQRAEARAMAERRALDQASGALDIAETNLYFGRVGLAQRELTLGNPWDAVRILNACKPKPGERDRRSWEWYYLKNASRGELMSFQAAHDWVWDLAYSPDGAILATAAGTPYMPQRDTVPGELSLWDARTGRGIKKLFGHTGAVRRVRFSPDGRSICSVSFDKTMRVWDVATGETVGEPLPCQVDGGPLFDGYGDAGPCWFTADGAAVEFLGAQQWQRLDLASGSVTSLPQLKGLAARSPDGQYGAFARSERDFEVIELATGRSLGKVQHPLGPIRIALSPEADRMMMSHCEHLESYEVAKNRRQRIYSGPDSWVETVQFSADGQHVAASGSGRVVLVWSQQEWHPAVYAGHAAEVRALAFSPNGRELASCDRTGQVVIWDLTRNPRQQLLQPGCDASGQAVVGLSENGDEIMTVFTSQHMARFNRAGQRLADIKLDGLTRTAVYPRLDITLSPDCRYVAGPLDHEPNVARIWDTSTGKIVHEFRGHRFPVTGTAWSGDGRRLAIRSLKRDPKAFLTEVWVWDTATGNKLYEVTSEPIVAMALSSDGSKLGGGNRHGEVMMWDVASGRELWRRIGHQLEGYDGRPSVRLFAMAFSPNDDVLASGGFSDGGLQLWKTDSGDKLNDLLQNRPTLTGVAFTPDGQRVAAVGYDGEVRMWDVATGQFALSLSVPTGARRADLAYTARPMFSKVRQRLVVLNWNGYIAVWDGEDNPDIHRPTPISP